MATDAGSMSWSPRRIGVLGAGAMGTSLAAILGAVAPVVLICRNPDRAAEIFKHGAKTEGLIRASAHPVVVRSAEDLRSVGGVSAVFITTKTASIPSVAEVLRPLLHEIDDQPGAPFLVSYQNGIEPGRQLMSMLGDRRVLRMVLNLGAAMRPDRTGVDITFDSPPHAIGCLHPEHRPACERLADLLTRGGLRTEFDEQIERRVWFKGILNAATNPIAALVNATVGQVLDSPAAEITDRLLHEGISVAEAEGLDLGVDAIDRMRNVLQKARSHTPSMLEDIRAGRETEVGQLNRQIIERARRLGVPVPTHEVIDALIETFDWKVYTARSRRP